MELTNEFTVPVPVERAWEVLTDVELIAPCMPGAQLQEVEGDEYRGVVKVKVGPITAQYKGAATFQEQDEAARRLVLKAEGRDTRGQGSASALITVTMTDQGGSTDVKVDTDLTIKGKVAQFGRGMIADVSAKLLDQFVECLEGKLDAPAPASASAEGSGGSGDGEQIDSEATTEAAVSATGTEPAVATPEPEVGAPYDATAPVAADARSGDDGAEPATGDEGKAEPISGVRTVESPEREPVDLLDAAGGSLAKRVAPVAVVVFLLWWHGRRRSNHGTAA